MSEELPKLDLLIKMMKMTTACDGAGGDNIALVAMRKVNAMLSAEGWDWEKLLRGKVTIIGDPFQGIATPPQRTAAPPPPPRAPAPPPPPPPSRPKPQPKFVCVANGYAGHCHYCSSRVEPGLSWAIKDTNGIYFSSSSTTTWYKYCHSCYSNLMRAYNFPVAQAPQPAPQPTSKWAAKRKANPKTLDDLANF